jgi:hypothetical protein
MTIQWKILPAMRMKRKQLVSRQKRKAKRPVEEVEWIKQPEHQVLQSAVFRTVVVAQERDKAKA